MHERSHFSGTLLLEARFLAAVLEAGISTFQPVLQGSLMLLRKHDEACEKADGDEDG